MTPPTGRVVNTMLKCPNPSCPYVFDPSQVPVGVILSCPRCAMQFTLGPPAPTTSTPAASPGYAPAVPPAYPSGYASSPSYAPPEPANEAFEAVGRKALEEHDPAEPPGRRGNKLQVFILAGVAAVLMAGTALAIIFAVIWRRDRVSVETATKLKDFNVAIDSPLSRWSSDDDTRAKLGPPYILAYKRGNPEAYMAFGARDYDPSSPRMSELREGRYSALNRLFNPETLQREPPIETKWLGESIDGNKFRIQSTDGLIWQGEVYSVAHKGIGYWWISWSGENDFDGLKDEFASFRNKFKLLDLRKNWKEKQSNVIPYKGETVNYTILDAEDIWKETSIADYKESSPDIDKRLRIDATPKRDRKALRDEAELRVYLIDDKGDPLTAARKYVEQLRTREIVTFTDLPAPTFEERKGEPEGDPSPNTVDAPAPVVRLQSTIKNASSNANQLIVLSGIRVGDKVVVVHCWCEWAKRGVFETKFIQIASSLREGK